VSLLETYAELVDVATDFGGETDFRMATYEDVYQSLRDVGKVLGVSRQRVQQIREAAPVSRKNVRQTWSLTVAGKTIVKRTPIERKGHAAGLKGERCLPPSPRTSILR
jgi:hypothetical protein